LQVVYDFIEDHIKYETDELTEYEFGTNKCVSCGNPSEEDFCEFCLKEE